MSNKLYPDWDMSAKPTLPPEPRNKQIKKTKQITLKNVNNWQEICLADLNLPEGTSLKDVFFYLEAYNGNDDVEIDAQFFLKNDEMVDNPEYVRWKNRKDNFEKELKHWENWAKKEKKDLNKQLNDAELFLKKHGRL